MNPSLSMRDGSRDGGPGGTFAAGGTAGAGGGSGAGALGAAGTGALGFSAAAGGGTGALGFSATGGGGVAGTAAFGFSGVAGGAGGVLGFSGAGAGETGAGWGASLGFSTRFGADGAMSARSCGLTPTLLGSDTGGTGGGRGFLRASRADSRTSSEDFEPSRTTIFSSSFRESER